MKTVNNKYFRAFLVAVIIVLMAIALGSCGVLKNHYLQKYCQNTDSVSENTTIVFRDSSFNVVDTVIQPLYLPNPCKYLCDSLGQLKPVKIVHSDKGVTKTIENKGGQLVFDCDLKGYSVKLKNAIKETIKDKFKQITIVKRENYLTGWQWFQVWCGRILLAYALIKGIMWAVKKYFKPI